MGEEGWNVFCELSGAVLASGAQSTGHGDKTCVSSLAGLVAGDTGKGRR